MLVMDEVSNELTSRPWRSGDYLNSFIGIVILVSHDRYFLDNTVDRIFAFDGDGHFRQYEGGYTDYLEARKRELGTGAAESMDRAAGKKAGGAALGKPEKASGESPLGQGRKKAEIYL